VNIKASTALISGGYPPLPSFAVSTFNF
jgi:hypothetical protein